MTPGSGPGAGTAWTPEGQPALLTDLYQLTMVQAYLEHGLTEPAAFSLFSRRLPPGRNYLLAAGLADALETLEDLRFSAAALEHLAALPLLSRDFVDALASFEFTGEVHAVPEGTPLFANEPLLEVVAPLPEAQLVETMLLNQLHYQTVIATKASRVVRAAAGRPVIDFGLRHAHGTDAGLKLARAGYLAGLAATSNVLAGARYGIPVEGSMAHSYVEAHGSEYAALRDFVATYPDAILLVDTYDTLAGVEQVIRLAAELGDGFRVRGIRLDSGDLAQLARRARAQLDAAGLDQVRIFASGSLDESSIADLVTANVPIDGFGVGTLLSVSADAPYLDTAYKLVAYAGRPRMKLSPGKATLPGRKQVFRRRDAARAQGDVVGLHDEDLDGEPLLRPVMRHGRRLPSAAETLEQGRRRAAREIAALPPRVQALQPADPPYPVAFSSALTDVRDRLAAELRRG